MQRRFRTHQRAAITALLFIAVSLGVTSCAGGGGGSVVPTPDPSPDTSTTVSGFVYFAGSGDPYGGVTVLFRNVYGNEVHTDTDASGYYEITLAAGTYSTFAVDNNSLLNAAFDLVDSAQTVIEVPPSTQVDFAATPIEQIYGG